MSGFLAISRKLFAHKFWTERREFSRAEAWLDLIRRANWQEGSMLIGNTSYTIGRGQVLASERQMAEWWGWSQKRVQNFLKLGVSEEMISITKESVGSRITLCKYESYNTSGISLESEKNQLGISLESAGNQQGIAEGIKSNNIKKNKQEQKEETQAQAGGFDFEKLANSVGRTCAKLLIEGEVGKQLEEAKRKLLRQWLAHQNQKGNQITTTLELHTLLETFKENTVEALQAGIKKSAAWKVLVVDTPKAEGKNGSFPDDWSPQIEARYAGVELSKYWQHLTANGWKRRMVNGQPIGWTKQPQPTQN